MGESGEGCLEGPCGEKMKKKGGGNVVLVNKQMTQWHDAGLQKTTWKSCVLSISRP